MNQHSSICYLPDPAYKVTPTAAYEVVLIAKCLLWILELISLSLYSIISIRLSAQPFSFWSLKKTYYNMGSVGDSPILRKNGEILPESAIEELISDVGCRVVVKGRVEDEQYKEAIDRWNQTGIKEAVSL